MQSKEKRMTPTLDGENLRPNPVFLGISSTAKNIPWAALPTHPSVKAIVSSIFASQVPDAPLNAAFSFANNSCWMWRRSLLMRNWSTTLLQLYKTRLKSEVTLKSLMTTALCFWRTLFITVLLSLYYIIIIIISIIIIILVVLLYTLIGDPVKIFIYYYYYYMSMLLTFH